MQEALLLKFFIYLSIVISPAYGNSLIPDQECALVIASRESISEVKQYIRDEVKDARYITVYQSENSWYAITNGFLKNDEAKIIISDWKDSGRIPYDSFCSKGESFVREVLVNNHSYTSEGTNNYSSGSCNPKDVNMAKVACYSLSVGPKACSQAITENNIKLANSIEKRISLSAACAASINAAHSKEYLPEDFVMTVADELWETGCEQMKNDDANPFVKYLLGTASCVLTAASWLAKIDLANECVNDIERKCGS